MAQFYICSNVQMDYFMFLVHCLRKVGLPVEPVACIDEGSYRGRARSKGLIKIGLRLDMYIRYPLQLLWKSLTAPRHSVFVVTSNTFYAPLLVAVFGKLKGHTVIHLVYDLFPDALVVVGVLKAKGILTNAIGCVARLNQRWCGGSVYLGDFLRRHAERSWGKAQFSAEIDISGDVDLFAPGLKRYDPEGKMIFHYGGQLGHMHDADAVIASIRQVWGDEELADRARFQFLVSGAQAKYLESRFEGTEVEVLPTVPSEQWRELVKDFHVGLVTLSPGGATVCLPSKTYGMMAGGLAIVAICPPWSDLAQLVEENEAGWIVSNSPYSSPEELEGEHYSERVQAIRAPEEVAHDFEKVVREILSDPGELLRRRQNAKRVMQEKYDASSIGGQWKQFLGTVGVLQDDSGSA